MQGVELGEGRFIDVVNVFYKYYHNLVLVKVCSFVRLVYLFPIAKLTSFLRKYLPNVIDKFSCSLFRVNGVKYEICLLWVLGAQLL